MRLQAKPHFIVAENLARERKAEHKSEFLDGEIFPRTGASLSLANCYSSSNRELEQAVAMRFPCVTVQRSGIIVRCSMFDVRCSMFDGLPESGTVYKRLAEKRSTGHGGRRRVLETPYFSLQHPVINGLFTKAHLLTPRIDDYDIRRLEMFDVSSGDTGMPRTRYPTDHGVADFNGLASLTLISEK